MAASTVAAIEPRGTAPIEPTKEDLKRGISSVREVLSLVRKAQETLEAAESNPAIEVECAAPVEDAIQVLADAAFQLRVAGGLLHE